MPKKSKKVVNNIDTLPFTYFNPDNEFIYWTCDYVKNDKGEYDKTKLISYYKNDKAQNEDEKFYGGFLENIEQAKFMRDELIKDGWIKFNLPSVQVKPKK